MRQTEEQEYQDPEEGEEGVLDSEEENTREREGETRTVGEDEHDDRLREVLQSSDNVRNYV